jgi:hypothetical protein
MGAGCRESAGAHIRASFPHRAVIFNGAAGVEQDDLDAEEIATAHQRALVAAQSKSVAVPSIMVKIAIIDSLFLWTTLQYSRFR